MKNKKITIITINKNNSTGLEKTLTSINLQKKIYELVVIDGDSKDNSYQIILKNKKIISKYISEKDKNISDAFNKGISFSNSLWVLFLNSGDFFYKKNILETIEKDLSKYCDYDLILYRMAYLTKKKIKFFGGINTNIRKMILYNTIPHQSLIMKKELFDKYGLYSLDFPIAQDYEFLMRIINKVKIKKLNKVLSVMVSGGITENNKLNCLLAFYKAKQKNYINNTLINLIIFLFGIIKLFIKKTIN